MNKVFRAVLTAALLAGSSASAAAEKVITQPDWLQRPSGQDMAGAYPKVAQRLEMEGYAVISCVVNVLGGLTDCETVAEAPKDLGFGHAAQTLAPRFRMRPMTIDGEPVSGGTARIPIHFVLPKAQPAAPPPAPRSPAAHVQALRLTEVLDLHGETVERYERWARELEFISIRGTPDASRYAAADALRSAARPRLEDLKKAYASAAAAVFTESELEGIVAFWSSSAGVKLRSDSFQAVRAMVRRDSVGRQLAAAREVFCRAHACPSEADMHQIVTSSEVDIVSPTWAEEPRESDLVAARPQIVRVLGVPGLARLVCGVTTQAGLRSCRTVEERPAGLGLGEAALRLAPKYRLEEGVSGVEGSTVAVTVSFPMPPEREAYVAPAPRSERALALAKELVELTRLDDEQVFGGHEAAAKRAAQMTAHLPVEIRDTAAAALLAGAAEHVESNKQQMARVYAALFTEDELETVVSFQKSPAGRAFTEKQRQLGPVTTAAVNQVTAQTTMEAQAAYCKVRDCTPPPFSSQPTSAKPEPSTRTP